MVKVNFQTIRNCTYRKEFAPAGRKFFPLRYFHTLKMEAIEENHRLIEWSTFDVRIFQRYGYAIELYQTISILKVAGRYFA